MNTASIAMIGLAMVLAPAARAVAHAREVLQELHSRVIRGEDIDTGLIDAVQVVYNVFDQAPEDESADGLRNASFANCASTSATPIFSASPASTSQMP